LPVLVWIYGGGFYQGAVRAPLFNGSYLVETSIEIGMPVIVVTVNSRLSGFGYLNSELTVREGISNLGLRDLWKALEWIQGIYLLFVKIWDNFLTTLFQKTSKASVETNPASPSGVNHLAA
jgi:hypothetical protein